MMDPVTSNHNKEVLMRRLVNASQYKIYPSVLPRSEFPLRKSLLTTRLWKHVCRQQQELSAFVQSDILFNHQQLMVVKEESNNNNTTTISSHSDSTTPTQIQIPKIIVEKDQNTPQAIVISIQEEQEDWSWLDNKLPLLNNHKQEEKTFTGTKRSIANDLVDEQISTTKKSKQDYSLPSPQIHHFTLDSPAPAGPASPSSSPSPPPNNSPVVLLSA